MSSRKATNKKHDVTINVTEGWDIAIASVTQQLQALEAMAGKLRFSLNYFLERKKSGDAFPGEEKLRAAGLIHDI